MKQTAIVIGATGLIGSAVIEQLVALKNVSNIIAINRRSVEYSSAKVHNQIVDFEHLKDYASLFKGNMLFSCLGTTRTKAGSIEAQRKVDYYYQLTAAQLAVNNEVDQYLLVSSSGANTHSSNPYLKMKGDLEHSVITLPFKRISIFQPSVLMGEREVFRLGEKLGGWALSLASNIPGLGRYRPIFGEQVAAKMVQVSQQNKQPPENNIEYFQLDEIFIED